MSPSSQAPQQPYPSVSVVIPTYNRAHLLERAITSAAGQTHPPDEIIVVDDASTDDTAAVIRRYEGPGFQYVRHAARKGGSAARNTGIRRARGRYIAFLDSDDEWLPAKLERQAAVFEADPTAAAAVCGKTVVWEGGRQKTYRTTLEGDIFEDMLVFDRGRNRTSSSIMIRRLVVEAGIFFDEDLPALQDWDFLVRVSRTFRVAAIADPLVIQHRDGAVPHTWNRKNVGEALVKLMAKYEVELAARPRARGVFHGRLAAVSYRQGDMEELRRHLLLAREARPSRIDLRLWRWLARDERLFSSVLRISNALRRRVEMVLGPIPWPDPFR